MKKLKSDWITAREVAIALGCSTKHIRRLMAVLPMKEGHHYININPRGIRATYRFHLPRIMRSLGI